MSGKPEVSFFQKEKKKNSLILNLSLSMTLKGLKLQVIMHSKKKIIFEYMFGDFPFWREHKESRRFSSRLFHNC